ncbi:type VII toxin-antitoxin system HepT family RNase toxin [Halanaerobium saccharolyticum]|uniref:type VII toxin-antitoxin system HepT family RNase toxin n=1 Tax=Halanaerobium saccharolyticum TaxID=43595 RepID=UPI003FCE290F
MDDILINKNQTVKRCLERINEEYQGDPKNLQNYTKQDSIILNIQRLSEAAIDIAMHIVAEKNLGVPQNSREAFDLLTQNKLISEERAEKLKAMVGFRNIAVHEYQKLNLKIVEAIIENEIEEIKDFSLKMLQKMAENN